MAAYKGQTILYSDESGDIWPAMVLQVLADDHVNLVMWSYGSTGFYNDIAPGTDPEQWRNVVPA